MMTIDNISCEIISGSKKYIIDLFDEETKKGLLVNLPLGQYDKSTIVDAIIRKKYSQDRVEAIINNHFLKISDWISKKFNGENVEFEDLEYEEFQAWRRDSKLYADMIIEAIK